MKEDINIIPKWSKSKEEIWSEHFEALISEERAHIVVKNRFGKYLLYTAVAAIILVFLIPVIYTRSIVAGKGEHISINLPDGSLVSLNAESKLTYKPLIWSISRAVKMEGEAYFEVKRGSKFSVSSQNGVVKVLGTKFNIISRGAHYSVSCICGKVEVSSDRKVILEKDTKASLSNDGKLTIEHITEVEIVNSWRNNIFFFTETPLKDVIEEISRQYNINIEYSEINSYIYTGNFSKESNVEAVLNIVALPYGLKLEKSENGYKLAR